MNEGVKGVEVASCNDQERTLIAVTGAVNPKTHRCHAHKQSAGCKIPYKIIPYKIQKIAGDAVTGDAVTAVASIDALIDITPEVIYG